MSLCISSMSILIPPAAILALTEQFFSFFYAIVYRLIIGSWHITSVWFHSFSQYSRKKAQMTMYKEYQLIQMILFQTTISQTTSFMTLIYREGGKKRKTTVVCLYLFSESSTMSNLFYFSLLFWLLHYVYTRCLTMS